MIPLQVRMQGWMRYREEQTADFSGGSLISICGENGAGKSSIFDAITYALFERHRLGSRSTEDLISQDCDAMEIDFDFEVGAKRWRVHRGRSRGGTSSSGKKQAGSITQSLYAWDFGSKTWIAVPGTNAASGLKTALDSILHLSEPAFTSSFLLQQGSATQFLDAQPADRFKIISSLIDLEAYQMLADAAQRASTRERNRLDDIQKDLLPLASVTGEAIDEQRSLAAEAQTVAQQAATLLANANALAKDAAQFELRSAEVCDLTAQIEAADALIARRDQIEADARRYETLKSTTETVSRVKAELDRATELELAAIKAGSEAAAIDVEALETALSEASLRAEDAGQKLARAGELLDEARAAERDAADFLTLANAVIAARERVAAQERSVVEIQTKLTVLPKAREEAETLAGLAMALPPLKTFSTALLKFETMARAQPIEALAAAQAKAPEAIARLEELGGDVEAAEAVLQAARESRAATGASLATLQTQLVERENAAGEAICSRCGQPVTPEHAEKEIADLTALIKKTDAVLRSQRKQEADAETARDEQKKALDTAREDARRLEADIARYASAVQNLNEAEAELKERQSAFESAAPATLLKQTKVKDSRHLTALASQMSDVPARKQQADQRYLELSALEGRLGAVQSELELAQVSRQRAEAEAGERLSDVEKAAGAHQVARAQLAACTENETQLRREVRTTGEAVEACRTTLQAATQRRQALLSDQTSRAIEAEGSRRTAAAHAEPLADELRQSTLADPSAVLLSLRTAETSLRDAPALLTRLKAATQDRATWEGARQAKLSEIETIPEAHRLSRIEAEEATRTAAEGLEAAQQAADEATSTLAGLQERYRVRVRKEREKESAERRQQRFRQLAILLGKGGLQGALVNEALQTITSHANSFLSRLTGGSLTLELQRGNSTDDLNLMATDTTSMREARSVHALSGSQKFRCAVALAFGIGQYSGAGGMRSIVIDEGFGSLDEVGQEQMVEELKALAGHMDKVIVVSHLEVFRDRGHFPFQLQVEKDGNASVVRRRAG